MKSFKLAGNLPTVVPVLPLKDMVVFPNVTVPLFLKGSRVVKLAESVSGWENFVGLFYQKDRGRLSPVREEISVVGTLARLQQVVRLDSGGVKAIADGICRVRLERQIQYEPYLTGEISYVDEVYQSHEMIDTLVRSVATLFKVALSLGRPMSDHGLAMIERAEDPGKLADLIAVYLPLKADLKQTLLEIDDPLARLKRVSICLHAELKELQPKLQSIGDTALGGSTLRRQRDLNLRQPHMRGVQKEPEPQDDPQVSEIKEFHEKIRAAGMSDDAVETATRELQRLERIPPHSPEYIVSRTYLEVLTSLPWSVTTEDHLDINKAQRILDEDHYDLATVKDRILEFLAVRTLNNRNKGPILCIMGPPGVGKTSLGRSIARALGGNSSASHSAACATKPRSGDIGARISGQCPAA